MTTKEHVLRNLVSVFQELSERYLVLFPHTLVMLSATLRMSGFIYLVSLHYMGLKAHTDLCIKMLDLHTSVVQQ